MLQDVSTGIMLDLIHKNVCDRYLWKLTKGHKLQVLCCKIYVIGRQMCECGSVDAQHGGRKIKLQAFQKHFYQSR